MLLFQKLVFCFKQEYTFTCTDYFNIRGISRCSEIHMHRALCRISALP